MTRQKQTVRVFATVEDSQKGGLAKSIQAVELTAHGMGYYRYKGDTYPGYINKFNVDDQGRYIPFIVVGENY